MTEQRGLLGMDWAALEELARSLPATVVVQCGGKARTCELIGKNEQGELTERPYWRYDSGGLYISLSPEVDGGYHAYVTLDASERDPRRPKVSISDYEGAATRVTAQGAVEEAHREALAVRNEDARALLRWAKKHAARVDSFRSELDRLVSGLSGHLESIDEAFVALGDILGEERGEAAEESEPESADAASSEASA